MKAPLYPAELRPAVDRFIHNWSSAERAMRREAVDTMLAARPDLQPGMVNAVGQFVDRGGSAKARQLRLHYGVQYVQASPTVQPEHLEAIQQFAARSKTLDGQAKRLGAAADMLEMKPDLTPGDLSALDAFVGRPAHHLELQQDLERARRLLRMTTVNEENVCRIVQMAGNGWNHADRGARLEVAMRDFELSRRLAVDPETLLKAPASIVPGDSHGAGSFTLLEKLRTRPDCRLAEEATTLCRSRVADFDRIRQAPRADLFRLEAPLYKATLNRALDTKGPQIFGVAAGAAAVGLLAATLLVPSSLGLVKALCMVGAGVAGMLTGGALMRRHYTQQMLPSVEADMRTQLEVPREYWSQQLSTHERLLDAVCQRALHEEANAPARDHKDSQPPVLEDGGLIVGGVRLPRQSHRD